MRIQPWTSVLGVCAFASLGLAAPLLAATPQHGTGLITLTPEQYDAQPHAARARAAVLLSKVDLTPYMPPVGDQGYMGSCSAWAVSYGARSYFLAAQTGQKPATDDQISSPAFVFNQTTSRPSQEGVLCGGASMVDALGVLVSEGSTSLSHNPYTQKTCVPAPTAQDKAMAGAWRVPGYETITAANLHVADAYKEFLEKGYPVIVGVGINTSEWLNFHGSDVYTLGPNSLATGGQHGGHAIVVVGYDDGMKARNGDVGAFRIQNSWGLGWGDHGYMWISYKAFTTLVQEAYVLKGVAPPMSPRDDIAAPAQMPVAIPVASVTPAPAALPAPSAPPAPIPTPATVTPSPPPPPANVPLPDLTADLSAITATFKTGEIKIVPQGDGTYRLNGYGCVDEVRYLRARTAKYGGRVFVTADEIPWPACEIRGILKDAVNRGAVDASVRNLAPDAPPVARGVQITEEDAPVSTTAVLRNGDSFEIDTEVQDQDPFVQIFYLQADQSAKEIWRGLIPPDGDGRRRLEIGGANSRIKLNASRPYGTEAVLVLAGKGVISPQTMPQNTSEVGFMDRLRSDLGQAVQSNPDIRAAIVQVEVRDSSASSTGWLVTPEEMASFGTNTDPGSNIPVNLYSDSHAPKITLLSPSTSVIDGKLTLQATFAAKSGATIRPSSVRVLYRTPVGWFDVSDRVLAQSNVTASGLTSTALALPPGKHELRLSVQDSQGREAMIELNLTSGT